MLQVIKLKNKIYSTDCIIKARKYCTYCQGNLQKTPPWITAAVEGSVQLWLCRAGSQLVHQFQREMQTWDVGVCAWVHVKIEPFSGTNTECLTLDIGRGLEQGSRARLAGTAAAQKCVPSWEILQTSKQGHAWPGHQIRPPSFVDMKIIPPGWGRTATLLVLDGFATKVTLSWAPENWRASLWAQPQTSNTPATGTLLSEEMSQLLLFGPTLNKEFLSSLPILFCLEKWQNWSGWDRSHGTEVRWPYLSGGVGAGAAPVATAATRGVTSPAHGEACASGNSVFLSVGVTGTTWSGVAAFFWEGWITWGRPRPGSQHSCASDLLTIDLSFVQHLVHLDSQTL